MKILTLILLQLLLLTSINAKENDNSDEWELNRFNFYFEDDVYTQTDDGYSAGEKLSLLYYIPNEDYMVYDLLFLDFGNTYSYFTASLASQIFTPTDTQNLEVIEDDRPYAGWLYVETGIHKSSANHLRSISLQVGMVGPLSLGEHIQNNVHNIIGSEKALGWDNQLENELGVNLKYTHKWLFSSNSFDSFDSSFVPFVSGELGNVAINATAGANIRVGYNVPKDFGVSSIDMGADPGIPIYDEYLNMRKKAWSFSFNFQAAGSAVARDIFLDGNTFANSHSVDKENFVYYYGFGFTARYKNFVVDFLETHNSKRFKLEKTGHSVGTIIVSWLF